MEAEGAGLGNGSLPVPVTPGIVGEPGIEHPPEPAPGLDKPAPDAPGSDTPTLEPAAPEAPAPETPPVPGLDAHGLDVLFRTARTVWSWQPGGVDDDALRRVYDLLKLGPTSANCSPARFMFLRTEAAKERLRPALSAGNGRALAAPVVCIVAHDPRFYEDLPRLYPAADARAWFAGNDTLANETAFRNGTLQGAYLVMAARAAGLDCAPMSGFDNERVDEEFLVAQGWKSNFLVALGHGDRTGLAERAPRLGFDEACRLL